MNVTSVETNMQSGSASRSNAKTDRGGSGKDESPGSLKELLDDLVDNTDGDKVSVGDLLDALRQRTFGPLLLIPAIIAVAPTGAIPGMSIVTGTIILLISIQMLVGRDHAWLPSQATSFEFSRERLENSVEKVKPWADWVESFLMARWTLLAESPATIPLALICSLLAVSMYPLALVPFAVAIPGLAVIFFAIGLTLKDGVMIVIGYALSALTAFVIWYAFS